MKKFRFILFTMTYNNQNITLLLKTTVLKSFIQTQIQRMVTMNTIIIVES